MKKFKKVSLLLTFVMVIGMLAGCGAKFDASSYVKAVLDNAYKNDSKGYVDLKIASQSEAEKIYEDGIDNAINAMTSTAGVTFSDDVIAEYKTLFKDLYGAANYTVKASQKESDGSYTVTVEYKKLKVFGAAYTNYIEECKNLNANDFSSQQEMYDEVMIILKDCIRAELDKAEYDEPQTTTMKVSVVDKKYTVNQTDLTTFETLVFDFDAIQ